MTGRRLKHGYYVLEGLNALATAYYFNYLFFFLQSGFGYGDRQNQLVCALSGLVYAALAWFGGSFAQRHGYFRALRLGFGLMLASLLVAATMTNAAGQLLAMGVWTFGMCFTWPTLEALVSEGESPAGLPRTLGIYNLVWAAGAATAYFSGGAMLEKLGPQSIFLLPATLHLVQLLLLVRLEPAALLHAAQEQTRRLEAGSAAAHAPAGQRPPPERTRLFLRLAWLANPFAYMAMNAVIPVIPGLAERHALSPMWAGIFCSTWLFARLGSFLVLWRWEGWHYRFRWFVSAYLLLILSFATILISSSLGIVLVAQLVFGACCGLMYYSSLFYSMDVGDTKGEHGGIHETAIGVGIFAGPALGAAGLQLFPGHSHAGAWTVSATLLIGLAIMLATKLRRRGV